MIYRNYPSISMIIIMLYPQLYISIYIHDNYWNMEDSEEYIWSHYWSPCFDQLWPSRNGGRSGLCRRRRRSPRRAERVNDERRATGSIGFLHWLRLWYAMVTVFMFWGLRLDAEAAPWCRQSRSTQSQRQRMARLDLRWFLPPLHSNSKPHIAVTWVWSEIWIPGAWPGSGNPWQSWITGITSTDGCHFLWGNRLILGLRSSRTFMDP